MASYDWIDIQVPQDYDRLVQALDAEFDPKGIAGRLKSEVTAAAKGVLVEHGYVDKDYRSTFYNFYARRVVSTGPTASVCTSSTLQSGTTKPRPISALLTGAHKTITSVTSY